MSNPEDFALLLEKTPENTSNMESAMIISSDASIDNQSAAAADATALAGIDPSLITTRLHSGTNMRSKIELEGLRFAPPEIREMIFIHVFKDGFTEFPITEYHPLLKALHCDDKLYAEALAVFSKLTRFAINFNERKEEGDDSTAACKLIRKLRISFIFSDSTHECPNLWNYSFRRLCYEARTSIPLNRLSLLATNIQQVKIFFNDKTRGGDRFFADRSHHTPERMGVMVRNRLHNFSKLKTLSINYVITAAQLRRSRAIPGCLPYPSIHRIISQSLSGFEGSFEVNKYITKIDEGNRVFGNAEYRFVWRAMPGEVLRWSLDDVEKEVSPEDIQIPEEVGVPSITKEVTKRGDLR